MPEETTVPEPSTLRYEQPAAAWTDALPIGNGRLGAMVFGGTGRDRLQVNDETCWSGSPADPADPSPADGQGPEVLAAARAALAVGDVGEAERQVRRLQGGWTQSYQPLVDLWLDEPEPRPVTRYGRQLRLDEAVATHVWRTETGTTSQESFVSHPAGVLVVHRRWTGALGAVRVSVGSEHPIEAPESEDLSALGVSLWSGTVRMPAHTLPDHVTDPSHLVGGEHLVHDLSPGCSVTAAVVVGVHTDGTLRADPSGVGVSGASWLTIALATATDHAGPSTPLHGDVERLRGEAAARSGAALAQGAQALRLEHVADHSALFGRVQLQLGPDRPAGLPTDRRLERLQQGDADPALAALAFDYGRYLMIAGSRSGGLPLTLQGIWNAETRPPWSSNYTININTEMNYWPALVTNLAECHRPLLDWLDGLADSGSRTAAELYGVRGWCAHHNSDAWGFSLPTGRGGDEPCWSCWPFGGVWLARSVAEHHAFTGDLTALRRSWPVLTGAARFVLDWLVELPDGTLGTRPSTSPENTYRAADGEPAAVVTSSTADLAMSRDLLTHLIRLAPLLPDLGRGSTTRDQATGDQVTDDRVTGERQAGHQPAGTTTDALVAEAVAALARLPRERVAPDGRLAEWQLADHPEVDPQHRHQSHLFGVHPGTSIDPDQTPELARAALASLDARGPDSTGWSLAWRLNLRARLRDPEGASQMLRAFLRPVALAGDVAPDGGAAVAVRGGGVYRNLFCAHPPFQIDGNFGYTAGVAELLLQSHRRVELDGVEVPELHLLPCLPTEWAAGSVRGLRARGGVTVDLTWADHRPTSVRLVADEDTTVQLRRGDKSVRLDLVAGQLATG